MQMASVIGGGPAGLMAAEVLAHAGIAVTVYDQMPSVGRKMLMAGRGGLNLTHAEPLPIFLSRYGSASDWLEPIIAAYPPQALIAWCNGLGQATFTGSSARVFPTSMKASPLLRAWQQRLRDLGVDLQPRHRWTGWDATEGLCFSTPNGDKTYSSQVVILALGGASWPRLGSDAKWTKLLPEQTSPFRPANCGFSAAWTPYMARFAGRPLKRLTVRLGANVVRGEAVITNAGLEGGVIYALSAQIRDAIQADGFATLLIDLRPDLSLMALRDRLSGPRRSQSLANTLRKQAGLMPEAIGLVQEVLHGKAVVDDLPALIKALPIRLLAPAPIERAISSAGGLRRDALDDTLMLRSRPGIFAAGEMLDWEAPTGGYLLQASFSTGVAAANGALAWLKRRD